MSSNGDSRRRLDLRDAFAEGLSLAASRNGLVFVAAFFVLEGLTVLLSISGSLYLPLDQAVDVGGPSDLPVGTALSSTETIVAGRLSTGFTLLVSIPLTLVAIRTFVAGATDRIPQDCLFHRLGRATLSGVFAFLLIVGALAVLFAAGVGGVVLVDAFHEELGSVAVVLALVVIVGGVVGGFAAIVVHVLFVNHEIAVRGRGLRDALSGSATLVRGNRLRVFVLAALPIGIALFVRPGGRSVAGSGLDPRSAVLLLGATALYAVLSVTATAVLARAYRQLAPAASSRIEG